MSQDDKKPPGTPEGSLSSQDSPSVLDPSLQEIISEIARGIRGSTQGNLAVQKIATSALQAISKQIDALDKSVASQVGQQGVRQQQRVAELQRAIGELNEHVANIVAAMKALYDAFISKSIDERGKLDGAIKALERATQDSKQFMTQRGGEITDDAISMTGVRVRWITVWKFAKAGVPLYKYLGLSAAITASIYKLFEGISPYTHWFSEWFS